MKKFEHPYLTGVIGKQSDYGSLQNRFKAVFKKKKMPFVYLSFKVAPRYLKNVVKCMKLMDVVGLNVTGDYQKKVPFYVDLLDISAKKAKKVNIIVKKGKKFIGYYQTDIVDFSVKLWSEKAVF